MMLGLEYGETFRGSFFYLDAPEQEHPFAVAFVIRANSVRALVRERAVELSGTVLASPLGEEVRLRGTVGFKVSARRVPYEFWFETKRGQMRFLGEKDIHPVWPRDSLELLTASIFDVEGKEIARARLRYETRREMWNTIRSLRLRLLPNAAKVA
jgi:hypothetical protein